jgi:hypothetical protein
MIDNAINDDKTIAGGGEGMILAGVLSHASPDGQGCKNGIDVEMV